MGETVIVGSLDGYVYGFDAKSGAQKWKFAAGPVRGAAVGRDGIVFIGSEDARLFAVNAESGKEVWAQPAAVGARILASPALSNGSVVVQTINNQVLAFDAATGQKKWEFATDK